MPDRPEGGTYLNKNVQLLLHRRILSMDGRGINEPLNVKDGNRHMIYIYIYIYI